MPAAPVPLLVVGQADGSVVRIDGNSGRALGRPVPAGPAPRHVVIGPGGDSLVALSGQAGQTGQLTFVSRRAAEGETGADGEGWVQRALAVGSGADVLALAGGGAYAAAVYVLPPEQPSRADPGPSIGRCHLAVIDLRDGEIKARYPVCGARDLLTGVVMEQAERAAHAEHGESRPVIYLALWARASDDARALSGGRVVAIDGLTGSILGTAPVGGLPRPLSEGGALARAGASEGEIAGDRLPLYVVEALPGATHGRWSAYEYAVFYRLASEWRLLTLDAITLETVAAQRLPSAPLGLVVAPGGRRAYVLAESRDATSANPLYEVDLAMGASRLLDGVPARGVDSRAGEGGTAGMVVTGEHLFVPSPGGDALHVIGRAAGRVQFVLRVGRRPAAVLAG